MAEGLLRFLEATTASLEQQQGSGPDVELRTKIETLRMILAERMEGPQSDALDEGEGEVDAATLINMTCEMERMLAHVEGAVEDDDTKKFLSDSASHWLPVLGHAHGHRPGTEAAPSTTDDLLEGVPE